MAQNITMTYGTLQKHQLDLVKAEKICCSKCGTSVSNHIQDVHEGHSDIFQECAHGPLDDDDRDKEWLEPGTKACEKLCGILENKILLKDIRMLSPEYQTSSLEAFHSLILHFAPKHTGFSFLAMHARVILAAIHYNENSDREQATTGGELQYSIRFPKFKKGGYSVRKEKTNATYGNTIQ
ncbi:hypothetical protein QZH41_020507 [Actinostola sp. cb2023]|nr:hypothetical protein QZH41_020507 [Actinostola sp. cb2023]